MVDRRNQIFDVTNTSYIHHSSSKAEKQYRYDWIFRLSPERSLHLLTLQWNRLIQTCAYIFTKRSEATIDTIQ